MNKKITCIQCPQGCQLSVDVENGYVIKVTGHKCPRGEAYARQEIENPLRTLTTTVLAEGLTIKMVPVKTSKPIPKSKLLPAKAEIQKIKLVRPVKIGEVLIPNLLDTGADLIACRSADSL